MASSSILAEVQDGMVVTLLCHTASPEEDFGLYLTLSVPDSLPMNW